MDSPTPKIIEPRYLLYKWEIVKLQDRSGNEKAFTVIEANELGITLDVDWQPTQFPRAFFEKQDDGSYRLHIFE